MNPGITRIAKAAALLAAVALQGAWAQQGPQGAQAQPGARAALLALAMALHPTGSAEFSTENTVAMVSFFLPVPEGTQLGRLGPAAQRLATDDPKLHLTTVQIDQMLPSLRDLADNPYPSPSKARKTQAGVEGALSKEQKKAWDELVKNVEQQLARLRDQGGAAALQDLSPVERQQLAERLEQARSGAGSPGATARQQLAPEEQRKLLVRNLLRRLEQRRRDLGG